MPQVEMKVNETFLKFMEVEEGYREEAYDDMQPNRKLKPGDIVRGTLTIGIGHTGPDVYIGQLANRQQIYKWFDEDCAWAQKAVNMFVKVPLTQNQFNALVSMCFNIGKEGFRTSTLVAILNGDRDRNGTQESAPDYEGVPAQMMRWIYSAGQPILKGRREREVELWNTPDR